MSEGCLLLGLFPSITGPEELSLIRTLSVRGAPLPKLIHLAWPSLMQKNQQKWFVFKAIPPLPDLDLQRTCHASILPNTHPRANACRATSSPSVPSAPAGINARSHSEVLDPTGVLTPGGRLQDPHWRSSQLSPDVFPGQKVLQQRLPVGLSLFTPK